MADVDGGGSELVNFSWEVTAMQAYHNLVINIHLLDRALTPLL